MGRRKKRKTKNRNWIGMVSNRERDIVSLERNLNLLKDLETKAFANSLVTQFKVKGYLSDKQWFCVTKIAKQGRYLRRKSERAGKSYFIYVIQADQELKIGMSHDPERRLKALQTSNPSRLSLLHSEEIGGDITLAKNTERKLHRLCKKYRIGGEWFKEEALTLVREFFSVTDPADWFEAANNHMAEIVKFPTA